MRRFPVVSSTYAPVATLAKVARRDAVLGSGPSSSP